MIHTGDTRTIICSGIALSVAILHAVAASDLSGLRLEGTYTYDFEFDRSVQEGAGVATHIQGAFSVSIQGTSWIANYRSTSAPTNGGERDAELKTSCDGKNTYVVHLLNPLMLKDRAAKDTSNPTRNRRVTTVEASVYPGVCPPPMEIHGYNLWIAFISRTVWDKPTGKAKPPGTTTDLSMFYNPDFFCEYAWSNSAPGTELPELLLRSGRRWLARDPRQNGKLRYVSFPAPFENGFTLAEARWLQATNVAGMIVPTKLTFSCFIPRSNATSLGDVTTFYTCQCLVTNISTAEVEAIPAGLQEDRLVMVRDHRFAQQGHPTITYGITNKWSSTISADLAFRLKAMPKESLEHESMQRDGFKPPAASVFNIRVLTRITIGTLVLLPLAILAVRGLDKKHKHINERLRDESEE